MIVWALLLMSSVGPGAAVVAVTSTQAECQALLDALPKSMTPAELARHGARCERTKLVNVEVPSGNGER